MMMSGAIHNLIAAQAASYAKGQESLREHSKDKADEVRLLRQQLAQAKGMEQQKKTGGAQKGILA